MAELVGSTSMPGALTRAAGGTLFIDEIEALSPEAQAGLSRVLEERRYRAPGDGASEREADVNFIVGTSTNLLAEVRAGRFREDLYYRVNVFPVRLPPLRERLDEVPEWAAYMLERSHGACARAHLTPAAVAALRAQPWPGNLRQLDNVVRRSHAFASVDRAPEARTELAVDERHVRHALALEGSPEDNLTRQLWSTARALAREAVRRREADANALSLETLDGFRGMVLGAVVQLLHSRDQAFRLFAREHLLNGRNHHRALKRELARTRRLVHALDDGYVDPELLALVELGRPAREVVRTVRPRA